MSKFKVTIWNHDGYDLASCSEFYNYLCFKEDLTNEILEEKVSIGIYTFLPGRTYEQFGSSEKTSSGFVFYKGESIEFVGRFRDFLLFKKPNTNIDNKNGYLKTYFTWNFSIEPPILIIVNPSGAGRVIEMTEPPTKKFTNDLTGVKKKV